MIRVQQDSFMVSSAVLAALLHQVGTVRTVLYMLLYSVRNPLPRIPISSRPLEDRNNHRSHSRYLSDSNHKSRWQSLPHAGTACRAVMDSSRLLSYNAATPTAVDCKIAMTACEQTCPVSSLLTGLYAHVYMHVSEREIVTDD